MDLVEKITEEAAGLVGRWPRWMCGRRRWWRVCGCRMPGGPKIDKLDAVWLAERGMLRPSLVPPETVAEEDDVDGVPAIPPSSTTDANGWPHAQRPTLIGIIQTSPQRLSPTPALANNPDPHCLREPWRHRWSRAERRI
jgi:hypothetical protein